MPALGISSTGAGNLGASGRLREGNEGGSGHWSTEQTAFDELHCFIIDSVVCLFSQFAQQVNDKTLDLFRVDKRKKNWTDKGDHDYQEGSVGQVTVWGKPSVVGRSRRACR